MKRDLIRALDELYAVTVKLSSLMDQDENDTVNNLDVVDVYPFEYDFQEMPMRIAKWIEVYKEKLESIKLELTKSQLDMVYDAVCHLNWEVNANNEEGYWNYTDNQMGALGYVENYLRTKL